MAQEQINLVRVEIKPFLEKNGFIENEPNFFISDMCAVEIQEEGYAVCDGDGNTMYSQNHNFYWLVGYLTYSGGMSKDYKQ